ncbi:hypothetical protein ACFYOA_02050 [Streptomyces iakyrus]|uniref:hypothetical protein n=1 Tax=Streptomyces iakyrus TaxID=68219 RepID=UPI0036ABBE3F
MTRRRDRWWQVKRLLTTQAARSFAGRLLVATALKRWILGVTAVPEGEAASLSDLRTAAPSSPADRQKPTVAQGIG